MSIMQNVWSEGLKIFFNEKATLMKKYQVLKIKRIQNSTNYVEPLNNNHMAS